MKRLNRRVTRHKPDIHDNRVSQQKRDDIWANWARRLEVGVWDIHETYESWSSAACILEVSQRAHPATKDFAGNHAKYLPIVPSLVAGKVKSELGESGKGQKEDAS
jgi:hypothetical protein